MQSQNPGSGSDSNIPGSDWRTYRAYSEDLHLDDTGALIFCLSPLDNRNGYAVYDSANGARVGTLLWGSEKEADWQAKAQMEDLDHDGIKEIGISMADGEILWYHYRKVWRIPGRRINVVVLKKLIKKLTKEKPVIMGKTVKT